MIIISAWVRRIEVNEGKEAPITVVIGALQISVIRIRTSNILQYPHQPLFCVGRQFW